MKINKSQDKEIEGLNKKILDKIGIEGYQGIFNTLLGCANNLFKHLVRERGIAELPTEVTYSMLQIAHMMHALSAILNDEHVEIGGHFPTQRGAWGSDEDFEKRLILLVKLLHNDLKEEGKL